MIANLIEQIKIADKSPKYYQYYPKLFKDYFKNIDETIVLKLSDAAYLYYHSILFSDLLIDEMDYSKLPLISYYQEETIKVLTSIFGIENNFLKLWNKRRNEYFEAIVFEKGLTKKENVTIEEYETLADTKSAFGKVAIDCLYSIDNSNEDLSKKLLLSHQYFSVGFQLLDFIENTPK